MPRHVIVLGVPDRLAVRLQENVLPLAGMSQFPTVASIDRRKRGAVAGLPVGETPFAMQSLRVGGPSGWTFE